MRYSVAFKSSTDLGADLTLKELFSSNLRQKLQESELNGAEFAEKMGVSPGIVSKWIRGLAFPEAHYIDKMIDTFGWSYEDLLARRGRQEVGVADALMVLNKLSGSLSIKLRSPEKRPVKKT